MPPHAYFRAAVMCIGSLSLAGLLKRFVFVARARLSEVLDLKREDLWEDGLSLRRKKGSKTQVIEWSDRLQAATNAARNLPGLPWRGYVFHRPAGHRINTSSFQSAWQRLMFRALQSGLGERFSFHDLKAKGVSDFDGDMRLASGLLSEQMVHVYDRLPGKVSPTR
ncbi:MAG: hypothetical protein A2521_08610 [Deltaproteobacteria bacterium RIFOXYD12_FULL_57_12]|nr:MAG: hypothetical protein A2521_08610 [Deltaproteobacteria bacterium RIFOXYD12_FULL_57_12]